MAVARKEKIIYALDAETDPFKYGRKPKPFVWGLRGPDGEYAHFWGNDDCTEQLLEYLQDVDNAILYAHNGGKFDFFFLLPYLDPELFIINGRIAKATMFDGRIELRDSWLILPLPLSANDKGEIDYDKMEKENRDIHRNEILTYLRRDCDSLYNWISNFRDNFGGGLTLAGSAFKQLRKTDYPFEPTGDYFDGQFREFYFGGRVQCFQVGAFKQNLQYVDINSAYPYAMLSNHWQGSQYREKLKLPDTENGSWFATITARSKGALPLRHDNKLYFPDDGQKRTFKASGWEIIVGLETGTLEILKVHSVLYPTFTANFREYVDRFFAMKLEAGIEREKYSYGSPEWLFWNSKYQFAKLMLNSCYGKFGQDGRDFEKFLLTDFGDYPEDEYEWNHYAETEFLKTIYSRPDPVNRFYNVATAASITGFVRGYLWRAICASTTPLYCDTDSIICADFKGSIGSALGEWNLEAEPVEAYIAQRKMYALKLPDGTTKVASKGVRLTYDQIKNGVLSDKNIVSERDAPAFSLKYGARFSTRKTDFENLQKNACNNPPL